MQHRAFLRGSDFTALFVKLVRAELVHVGELRRPVGVDSVKVVVSCPTCYICSLQCDINGLQALEKGLGIFRYIGLFLKSPAKLIRLGHYVFDGKILLLGPIKGYMYDSYLTNLRF